VTAHSALPQEIKDIINFGTKHGIKLMVTIIYDSGAVGPITEVEK
jgi:cell shape-determining protein MreC